MENQLIQIAAAYSSGEIENDEMGAILTAMQTGFVGTMTGESKGVINAKTLVNTVDSTGNNLIAGENYNYRGEKVKVLREQFGAGNFLDTYYRVYYLGPDMEEHAVISEVSFVGGIFGKRVYRTEFEPIEKEKNGSESLS